MELAAPPSGYAVVGSLDAHRGELEAPLLEAIHGESGERVAILSLTEDELQILQRVAQLGESALPSPFDRSDPGASPGFVAWRLEGGETLRRRLARGPLEALPAVRIARGIAAGLRILHDAGIPHGRLRPAAILLSPDGGVRLLAAGLPQATPVLSPEVVDPGAAAVAYLSPDRLRSADESGSVADDLWALGVVLYEMLEGDLPFAGTSARTLRQAILSAEPMPVGAAPGLLPYELARLLDRTLARDSGERYGSIRDLLVELDSLESLLAPRPRTASSTRGIQPTPPRRDSLSEVRTWVGERRQRLASGPEPPLWRMFLGPGLVLLALLASLFTWCVRAA